MQKSHKFVFKNAYGIGVNSCNNNRLPVQCEKSFSLYICYKDHENKCFEKYSIKFHGQTEIDTVSHGSKYMTFQLSLLSLVWINKALQLAFTNAV